LTQLAISTARQSPKVLTAGGTAFELIPKAGGGWREKVLHSFGEGEDGFQPYGGLIIDASGNFYGTTTFVGVYSNKYGTVFALTPKAGGGWTGKVLHSFDNKGADGIDSQAGVIIDGSGNLYGTIQGGGAYAKGTVFELTPKAGGGWTEQVLHTFNGKDGIEV
jgi:uncharacterized repeat protein (TIGR03803 family)